VIDRLDLEIDPGQCLVILGPSGCGKSTLLRLIAGLITPTQGEVLLEPEGSGLGFVFQDASLLPWRTTLENVRLPLELDGCPKDVAHQECIDLLKDVGLGDFIDHYPDALSGGMRMRVSIARALAGAPRLLLLDEPFAALDEVTRQRLDSHLGRLVRERGITTLFVTHSISEAVTLADRIVVLSAPQGRIVLDERVHHDPDRDLQAPERLALMNRLSSILLNEGGA
jgi:NitT/TauT family transport system ATP-binding protein